jgi:hypothetical protein
MVKLLNMDRSSVAVIHTIPSTELGPAARDVCREGFYSLSCDLIGGKGEGVGVGVDEPFDPVLEHSENSNLISNSKKRKIDQEPNSSSSSSCKKLLLTFI